MFEYAPLITSTAFRLIRVSSQRTTQNNDICFDLVESDTETACEYTALSYQWGSDTKTHAILLNGEHFPLHENLWYFLRQLTLDKDDHMYWVDAICINQENPVERAEQVSRMADIFTSAHQVTVWLGPLAHIEFSLEILLHDRPVESTLSIELGVSKTLTQVNALNEILNLDYWRRAWILPELVLGKQIRLKCLRTYITLATFSDKVKQYMDRNPLNLTEYDAPSFMEEQKSSWTRSSLLWSQDVIKSLSILAAVADLSSGTQPFHLESWLPMVQKQGCKDARDRVYSLLGLLRLTPKTDGNIISIPVDYSKPVGFVYWDTIFSLLLSGSNKPNRRFIGEVAHLIIYTKERRPEHRSSASDPELTGLSRPIFFMSLSEYVNHPATNSRLSTLAQKVLLQSFLTTASFSHRHFYEAVGAINEEHDTISSQSEDSLAAYLGQHITMHCEPYVAARFGREICTDAYTWRCKECHQPIDDIYDLFDSGTNTRESTLVNKDCNVCSEHRSRIYTAVLDLVGSKESGSPPYLSRNTFQSTHTGPQLALEYQEINDIGLLTISCPANASHDKILCLRAPPDLYRQADTWMAKDSYGDDYQVPIPPYIVLAVTWRYFVSGKSMPSSEVDQAPVPTTARVPWLRLLKHVCDLRRFDLPERTKDFLNSLAVRGVE